MKNKYLRFISFVITSFAFVLVFNYNAPSAHAYNESYQEGVGTYVFGELSADTTWHASNTPYIVVGSITVPSGITLTVEPGTTVKFDGRYELLVNGTLNATGEKNNLITLTSNKSNPAKYDWVGVRVNNGGESIFKYSVIEYANIGINAEQNDTPYGLVSLTNSIIRHSNTALYSLRSSTTVMSYNDFYDVYEVDYYVSGLFINNNAYNLNAHSYTTSVFNSQGINAKNNNIIGVQSGHYFVENSNNSNQYKNNYWGTTDMVAIAARMGNNVNYEPIANAYITLDVTEPADDSVITSSTTPNMDFAWTPINGSGHNLDYYNLYIDNELVASSTLTSTTYNTSSLSSGYHQWYVEAVNNDATTYKSNNILGFNLDYTTPTTPITTTNVNCNEIGGVTWCYDDVIISLTASNSDFITYTIDGSTPIATTSETNFIYSTEAPISLASTSAATLKARGWKNVDTTAVGGALLTRNYNFDRNKPGIPIATPVGGVHDNAITVSLSSPSSTVIRYTIDGSNPNPLSTEFSDSIYINASTMLKAQAWNEHLNTSPVMTENYFITNASGGGNQGDYNANLNALTPSGAYISESGTKDVSFTANDSTVKLCYTTDGTTPTKDSTCVNDNSLTVTIPTGSTTIKVGAWSNFGASSNRYNDLSTTGIEYLLYDHGTNITDSIYGATTWTVAQSPYIIKRGTEVRVNAKLTIQPGVEVIFNNSSSLYSYDAPIEAIGDSNNYINVSCYSSSLNSSCGNISAYNASKFKYTNFDGIDIELNGNSELSYSILNNSYLRSRNSKINNSTLINVNNPHSYGYGISIDSGTIFKSNKLDLAHFDSYNGMINISGDNVSILNNYFYKSANSSDSSLFNISSGNNIKINNNNFDFTLANDKYIVKNNSDKNINARDNYWGSDSDSYITGNIYDHNDDSSLGLVYYQNAKSTPTTFDLIFPLGQTLYSSATIPFSWNALVGPATGVSHYELYIDNVKIADNLTSSAYSYTSSALADGVHSWYVKAIKTDNSEYREDISGSFTVDSSNRYVSSSLKGGTYSNLQRVSLSFEEPGSVIRYTLDGTEPTLASLVYVSPISTVTNGTTTIKAKAWFGDSVSATTVEQFIINTTPALIMDSAAIISFTDESYSADSNERFLQGIINTDAPNQSQAVGLIISLNKPTTCKYSTNNKDFTAINDNWYNATEGVFKSAHGTRLELIAPLGNLNPGDYKFYVTCSDGVDESSTLIQFSREASAINMRPILSPSSINSIKKIAIADNSWNNGWKWVFDITVPSDETMFKMKFNNWTASYNSYNGGGGNYMNNYINAGNNIRYYSPQATTANTPDSAILITTDDAYPSTAISLSEDARQDIDGRQIQVFVEMRVPTGTPNGSYSSNYSIYSE